MRMNGPEEVAENRPQIALAGTAFWGRLWQEVDRQVSRVNRRGSTGTVRVDPTSVNPIGLAQPLHDASRAYHDSCRAALIGRVALYFKDSPWLELHGYGFGHDCRSLGYLTFSSSSRTLSMALSMTEARQISLSKAASVSLKSWSQTSLSRRPMVQVTI